MLNRRSFGSFSFRRIVFHLSHGILHGLDLLGNSLCNLSIGITDGRACARQRSGNKRSKLFLEKWQIRASSGSRAAPAAKNIISDFVTGIDSTSCSEVKIRENF